MKSPLVEALRQASGAAETETSESSAAETAEEQKPQAGEEEQAPDAAELQLMETSAGLPLEGGILPIDGGGILPIDGGGILPIDGAADAAADSTPATNEDHGDPEAADAAFEESTALQAAQDQTAVGVTLEDHEPPPLPPLAEVHRHSRMPRLGLYSPALCLLLGAVATGGYFTYQKVSGRHQNTDLESLSSQIGAPMVVEGDAPVAGEGVANHFQLLVGPQAVPRRVESRPAPVARRAGGSKVGQRAAQSALTAAASRDVDDAALSELNEAFAAFERGDDAAAEAGYRRALAIAPNHPNALQGLAAILQRSGRIDESLQYYENLLSVEPNNAAAAVAILAERGDTSTAAGESEIKHLIQSHPDSAHLRFALGSLYAGEARWADARYAFDQAVRLDPANADYLFNLAVSLEHLSQYIDARHYYESSLAAADATSALDSGVVMARIERLALLANPENLAR